MPTPLPALPIRPLTMADLSACADLAESRGWSREERSWRLLLAAGAGYGIDDPVGGPPAGKGLAAVCVLTSYGPVARVGDGMRDGPGGHRAENGRKRTQRPSSDPVDSQGVGGGPAFAGRPEAGGRSSVDRGLAAVGKLLVAERYERQGLGRRLMRHVLDEADDRPLVLYATSYGLPLYQRLGFTDVGGAARLRGHLRAPDRPSPVTTRPATAHDVRALVRLDAEVLGVDRTALLTRLPSCTDRIQVAEEGSTITGYAAVGSTPRAEVVGPVIAEDTDTAEALITALVTGRERPVRLDIDTRHSELLRRLSERGLATASMTTAMTYGTPSLPGDWARHFAPLSLATG
ncbi:GNAT family N-acetyltransferase [Streptomyces hebeiensis]